MDGIYVYQFADQRLERIEHHELFSGNKESTAYINQVYVSKIDETVWMTTTSGEVLRCSYENGDFRVNERYPVVMPMSIVEDESRRYG